MKKMMIHRKSPSHERRKLSSLPLGCSSSNTSQSTVKTEITIDDVVAAISETKDKCVVGVAHHHYFYHRPKEVESFDSIVKKAGFHTAADGIQKFPLPNRKVSSLFESKVKPLSSEEGIRLMASLSKRRQRHPLVTKIVQKHRYSPVKNKKKLSKAVVLRPTQHRDERLFDQLGVISVIKQNWISKNLNPREKVQDVLRVFKLVFDKLDRDKAARQGESKKVVKSKIDCQTRTILKEMGMQLNCEKMIGPVPGIEVGDEFQFKAELNLVGLHFDIMGGIDYMKKGNMELATSIVSSVGNDYGDRFINDVMIYCGEGGNVQSKDQRVIKDQKLVAGNLALANSMKKKTPVRVIRGERRLDQRGKDYVYDGLYMVENYWQEKGLHNNVMFKFKLSRIAGQPFLKF